MALQDQIKEAQAEGYSSQEIVQFLSQSNPQVAEAVKEGYQPDEIISFVSQSATAPSPLKTAVTGALQNLLPSRSTLEAPLTASNKVGTMVEAGGAGLSNLAAGNPLGQASQDVTNVEQGTPPTSTAGKVGSTIGSFFTPNQIAMTTLGGEAIAPMIRSASTPVVKGLVNAFPKISDAFGASPSAISALAESPEAVANAASMPETAKNVAGTVQGLRTSGMEAASAGKALLSDTTPVTGLRDQVMNYAATLANSPGADAADKAAADYASEYAKKLPLNPSEADVNELIEDLDSKINTKFNAANPSPTYEAKMAIRRTLSEALQDQNPAYAKAMAQSSATQAPAKLLEQSFGVQGGNPSDRTINALMSKSNPSALATQKVLAGTPGLPADFLDQIRNAVAKNALQNTLVGKIGLRTAPYMGPAIQGGVQVAPTLGNAAYQTVQGLTNGQ